MSFDGSTWVLWQVILTVNSTTYIYFYCDWIYNPKPIYMLFPSSFFNVSFAFLAVILLETFFLFGNAEKHFAFGIPHVRLAFATLISASFCMLDIHHLWHVPGSLSTHRSRYCLVVFAGRLSALLSDLYCIQEFVMATSKKWVITRDVHFLVLFDMR